MKSGQDEGSISSNEEKWIDLRYILKYKFTFVFYVLFFMRIINVWRWK